jgi:hypothetical protein
LTPFFQRQQIAKYHSYYALSSASPKEGGKLFCYRPAEGTVTELADLTAVCDGGDAAISDDVTKEGESLTSSLVQGKSHVPFFEDAASGVLYFGTHVGYYASVDGMEVLPTAETLPPGITT